MSEVFGEVESVIKWVPWRNFRKISGKCISLEPHVPISLKRKKYVKRLMDFNISSTVQLLKKNHRPANKTGTNSLDHSLYPKKVLSYSNYLQGSISSNTPEPYRPLHYSLNPPRSRISPMPSCFSLNNHVRNKPCSLNSLLFSKNARYPSKSIKLSTSISRKVLFPPVLRNQPISLSPNPKYNLSRAKVHNVSLNTETLYEDNWLDSKYNNYIY